MHTVHALNDVLSPLRSLKFSLANFSKIHLRALSFHWLIGPPVLLNLRIRLYMLRKFMPQIVNVMTAHSKRNMFRYILLLFSDYI